MEAFNHNLYEITQHKVRIRKIRNAIACTLIHVAALIALGALFVVFGYVLGKGFPALRLDFFIKLPAPVGETGGGMANALVGTLIIVGLASAVSIPWGIMIGIYLSEYGRGKWANVVRFSADLLTSVPSIVVGLFVYVVVVLPMKRFSAIAGAASLAIIMLPIVARTTEELLKLVPTHIREAGLALGLPRWKVILQIVVRGSMGGLITGVILAIARAAGETAPLLLTALGNSFWHDSLDQPIASLPVQIYSYAVSPFEDWHQKAWTGALVLVMFVFLINLSARLVFKPQAAGNRD